MKAAIVGGRYRAAQSDDGTWSVFDVPVFADTKRTFKVNGGIIDRIWDAAWQGKALETAQRRKAANGYLGRLHVHHQGGPEKPEPVGFIDPQRLDKMTFDEDGTAVEKTITRVNYVGLSGDVMKRFLAGELAYASAEIPMDGRTEISSVALLPVAPPWHKLPPQTIGEVTPKQGARHSPDPVLAFHDTRESIQILTRFPLPEEVATVEVNLVGASTTTTTSTATTFQEEPGKSEEEKPLPKPSDPQEKPEKKKPDAEDSAKGSEAKLDEILSILKGLAGLDKKPEDPVDALPVVEMKDPVAPAKFAEEIGKRDATIQGLTEKLAKFEAKEKEDAAVASALKALEGVTGVDEKTVREVYAKFQDVGLTAWVEGRKINAPAEPTKEWAAGENGAPSSVVENAKFEAEFAGMPKSAQTAFPRGVAGFIEGRRLALGLPVKE